VRHHGVQHRVAVPPQRLPQQASLLFPQQGRVVARDAVQCLRGLVGAEEHVPREELEDKAPDGPHVPQVPRGGRLPLPPVAEPVGDDELRGADRLGAEHLRLRPVARAHVGSHDELAVTEVGDRDSIGVVEKDVVGLEVAVDDAR